jgi:hypothetical protein
MKKGGERFSHHKCKMQQINDKNHAKFLHWVIGSYILHLNIMLWKHIWHMDKCVNEWSTNVWMNECHTNFSSSCIFSNEFSMHNISAWNLQIMNEQFETIFITKSWDVLFLMANPQINNSHVVKLNAKLLGEGGCWEQWEKFRCYVCNFTMAITNFQYHDIWIESMWKS